MPKWLVYRGILDHIDISASFKSVDMHVGFVPGAPTGQPSGTKQWTRNLFPGAKGFDSDLFPVTAIAATSAVNFTLPTVDVNCTLAGEVVTGGLCKTLAKSIVPAIIDLNAGVIAKAFHGMSTSIDAAARPLVESLFNYDGHAYASLGKPSYCDISVDPSCVVVLITDALPASLTYQKLDWFWGLFGPYGSSQAYLPVKSLSARTGAIDFGLAPDPDGDGIPWYRDNCPDKANLDQVDTDGDGRGEGGVPIVSVVAVTPRV